eukprot:m.60091 g.60091  ORF g.60091 m.60091 type:complete len:480 (+) comp22799_c0_seq1:107-1546(+)
MASNRRATLRLHLDPLDNQGFVAPTSDDAFYDDPAFYDNRAYDDIAGNDNAIDLYETVVDAPHLTPRTLTVVTDAIAVVEYEDKDVYDTAEPKVKQEDKVVYDDVPVAVDERDSSDDPLSVIKAHPTTQTSRGIRILQVVAAVAILVAIVALVLPFFHQPGQASGSSTDSDLTKEASSALHDATNAPVSSTNMEITALKTFIEEQKTFISKQHEALDQQRHIVQQQNETIAEQQIVIQSLNANFTTQVEYQRLIGIQLNQQNAIIEAQNNSIVEQNAIFEAQNNTIVEQLAIVDVQNSRMDVQNKTFSSFFADAQALQSQNTGVVVHFAAKNVPYGYLPCNGTTVSRDKYRALFEVIGTMYGGGNTTFSLPDLMSQNRYIRAAGSSLAVGAQQDDATAVNRLSISVVDVGHSHSMATNDCVDGEHCYIDGKVAQGGDRNNDNRRTYRVDKASANIQSSINSADSETRPVSIALLPCIKY